MRPALAVVLALSVLLAACGRVDAPSWEAMTELERQAYCDGIRENLASVDWSMSRDAGSMFRLLNLYSERCQRAGYL